MLKTKTLNKTATTILILLLTLAILSVINININIIPQIPRAYGTNIPGNQAPSAGIYVNTTGFWAAGKSFNTTGWPTGTSALQAAVDNATAEGIYNVTVVEAGIYNTTNLLIDDTLYLKSDVGTGAILNTTGTVAQNYAKIEADDVILEGFTIVDNRSEGLVLSLHKSGMDNTTIRNNIFNKSLTSSSWSQILVPGHFDVTNLTIQNNTFYYKHAVAIAFNPWTSHTAVDVSITRNTFVSSHHQSCAMVLGGLNNTSITYNTINGSESSWGVSTDIVANNITIAHNTFNGNGTGDDTYAGGLRFTDFSSIEKSARLQNLYIYNNTFRNQGLYGIAFQNQTALNSTILDQDTIAIYYNNFENITQTSPNLSNMKGAVWSNITDVTINATWNWWGHDTGPSGVGSGDGETVSSYVDYDAWLGMYSKSITPTSVKGSVSRLFNTTVTNTGSNPSIGYVNITYPSSGWTYNAYAAPSHWYRSTHDGNTVVFRANPGYYLDKTESATFALNMTPTASGNWTVSCKNANDEEGYLPPPLEVLVDAAAPTVVITALPTYYSVDDGGKIWINGTITDDTYSTPSLAINNTTYFPTNPQTLTYNISAPQNYTWYFRYYNTSAIPDGSLAVNITGTDAAGNDEAGGEVASTIIDNTAPTLISLVVADDKIGNLTSVGDTFYMSGNATGLNFTITFSELYPFNNVTYLYNGTGTTTEIFQNNTGFCTPNSYNVTGIDTVIIRNITLIDKALPNNNTLTTSSYTILRDQEGPTVPTYTVTEICGGLIVKNLNATDNVGVQKYEVYINGTEFLEVTPTQLANTTLDWGLTGALNRSCVFDGTLVLNLTSYAGGHANLTIRAVDIGGNNGNFSTPTLYSTPEHRWYAVELQANWNMIGLPLIPASTARADVLSLILKQGATGVRFVYGYNNATDAWTLNPTTMVDGKGYWINMKAYDVMIVSGRVSAAPPALPPNYYLTTGWELAGYKAVSSMNCSTYLASLTSGSYFAYLYVWDATSQSWVTKTAGNNLDPGWGFWIWMYSNQTLIPPIL